MELDDYCEGDIQSGRNFRIYHNNIEKSVKAEDFNFCLPFTQVNVETDNFKLRVMGSSRVSLWSLFTSHFVSILIFPFKVCISGLYVNEEQIFVGKNNDLPFFVLTNAEMLCTNDQMATPLITIQNGEIIASSCQSK